MHVARHCALWHLPSPANDNGLTLIRRIDEPFTAWPFLGSRRMTAMLRAEGHADSVRWRCWRALAGRRSSAPRAANSPAPPSPGLLMASGVRISTVALAQARGYLK